MLPEIFVSELQTALASADAAGRTRLLKEALRRSFADLPPIVDELRNSDLSVSPATALAYAEHLVARRLPLVDGTARDWAEPCNWYCERGESSAEKSPVLMPQRMAFLGSLVSAYRHTGEDRYARAAHDYIMDYVARYWSEPRAVPSLDNWLDVGIRIGHWWHMHLHGGLYTALREWHEHPLFSGDDLAAILRAVTHMTNALLPEMALGSNWRIHQLSGVFTQGLCYPFMRDAVTWLQTGVNGLNEEFQMQFLADGSHEELSVGYGAGVWSVFVRFFALSREKPELGLRIEPAVIERIQEYYLGSKKPFGKSAGMGDVWAIRNDAELRRDSSPSTRLGEDGSVMSDRWAELRENAELTGRYIASPSSTFILDGAPEPDWTTRFNRSSGYLYMRNGWKSDSLYMSVNLGYYANCHCHYSLLGIEAAGFGREFIVDPGNSDYSGRPINANFRRTRAHSTMTVDGLNQSAHSPVAVSRLIIGDHYDFAVGAYRGGYLNGSPFNSWEGGLSASHFRHVLFVKDDYWIVLDAMTTHPGHSIETRFQLMPTVVRPLPGGGYRTGYAEGNLALIPLAWEGWEYGIHEGEENPIEGWLPAQGHRFVPAPVYKAVKQASGEADWHGTLLFPYRGSEPPRIELRKSDLGAIGFGFEIETDEWRDVVFISNSWFPRPYRIGAVESDAPLCHQRLVKGNPVRGCACEGNYLRIGDAAVFSAPGSLLAREFEYGKTIKTKTTQPRYKNR